MKLPAAPQRLAHFAINADDVERARRFYERVFGWRFAAWGPPGFYKIQTSDGADPGPFGALQARRELLPGQRTGGFECTISVASIDDTAAEVLAAGGQVLLAKSVIPGVGSLMFFRDSEGNVFGAMQYDHAAE
jgi:predicted enzyme related to lactoylglutathione lyase